MPISRKAFCCTYSWKTHYPLTNHSWLGGALWIHKDSCGFFGAPKCTPQAKSIECLSRAIECSVGSLMKHSWSPHESLMNWGFAPLIWWTKDGSLSPLVAFAVLGVLRGPSFTLSSPWFSLRSYKDPWNLCVIPSSFFDQTPIRFWFLLNSTAEILFIHEPRWTT